MTSSNSLPNEMQTPMSLPPNFANPAIPDVSAMMFPSGGDEPFLYPNQPLTTFENNQQFANKNNPYINNLARGPGSGVDSNVSTPQSQHQQILQPPSRASARDDNMEAQFFALPPYLEQARQQQQRTSAPTSFPQDTSPFTPNLPGPRQSGMPQQMQNGWPGQQQQQQQQPPHPFSSQGNNNGQNLSNINIQDLFGGAEWNAMIMDPGFRQ